MDNNAGWQAGMMTGEKGEIAGEGGAPMEGSADANYMYASQPGHNGTSTGENY